MTHAPTSHAPTSHESPAEGAILLAPGHAVPRAAFDPLRAWLGELLADASRPFSQRLLAVSAAVDLLAMYVPAAVAAGQAECPDAAAALALYLDEMRATEAERLWSIASRPAAVSMPAGKMFVAASIEGRHGGKSARSLFAGASGLLWFYAKAASGFGGVRFGALGSRWGLRRLLASLADLDAPEQSPAIERLLRERFASDDWLAAAPTLRLAWRRLLALYAFHGWHVAALSLGGETGEAGAERAASIVLRDFAPANALDPVAERWPVFPQTMDGWLPHRAYAPTMIALATRPRKD